MKNFLITGGAGFIGSNLIKSLKNKFDNINILSLDNYSTGLVKNHVAGVQYLKGNTWNINKIEELQKFKPDIIFHFGEYSRIPQSFDEPNSVFQSNILGTQQVLQYAVEKKCKVVYSGSSAIFGNNLKDQHLNPYAWTKSKNIELLHNYKSWYGLNFAICYFYNVYGEGQIRKGNYATVIGIFEEQFTSGKPLTVVKPGTQTRIFTHIDDIIKGVLLVGEKGDGDGYHIGNKESMSILDIVHKFKTDNYVFVEERRGERTYSVIQGDNKMESELGWKAERNLCEYIQEIRENLV